MQTNIDNIGNMLSSLANLAKQMPPSYELGGVTSLLAGPHGEYFGKLLPGKGIYLPFDLKELGITKAIPGVYEYSPIQRLKDIIDDERGSIINYEGILIARSTGKGEDVIFNKATTSTTGRSWHSLFRSDGVPAAGTYSNIPGGAALNSASTGAIVGLTNPTLPDKKYLLFSGVQAATACFFWMLVDLLVAAGNISATSTSAQTVNSTALTRYTDGAGVLMTFDVTSALGATPANLTVTYTNQGGILGKSTDAIDLTASATAQRLMPFIDGPFMRLAAGDYGVRSVQTVQLSADMGSGTLALNLYYPLIVIPGVASGPYLEKHITNDIAGLKELVTTSGGILGCLTFYCLASTSSTGVVLGVLRTCAG